MSLRKTKKNASPIKSISHDSRPFVFDPPLPTLWSSFDVSKEQLVGTLQGDAAQRLYDTVLSKFDIDDPQMTVPRRPYGKGNATTVPILSLGGFVALGSSVMRNRKLTFPCGCGQGPTLFSMQWSAPPAAPLHHRVGHSSRDDDLLVRGRSVWMAPAMVDGCRYVLAGSAMLLVHRGSVDGWL